METYCINCTECKYKNCNITGQEIKIDSIACWSFKARANNKNSWYGINVGDLK